MGGTHMAARKGMDAAEALVRRVQEAAGGPRGSGPTDLAWALRAALAEAGAASEVVGRLWVDGAPEKLALEAGDGTYDGRGRVMRHQLDHEWGGDRAPAPASLLRPGPTGEALLEAFRADMAREAPDGGWAAFGHPPRDGLRDDLAAMLAEALGCEPDPVAAPGVTLRDRRPDLAARAAALLAEAYAPGGGPPA